MRLLATIALKHLLARKRQSVVSMLGIVLGVAFFLAISSIMRGSENDFIRRLIDNTPHITVVDEFREPRKQPVFQLYRRGAIELSGVKPVRETRGIRGHERIMSNIRQRGGVIASPVLAGEALVSFAGRDIGITLYGMNPDEIKKVSSIHEYMQEGSVEDLIANPDGIIIGRELARNLSLRMGNNINVASPIGQVRTFKIIGIFRTGRADFDQGQTFVNIKRVQALFNKSNRINNIIIRLDDPYSARQVASEIEARSDYKSISWQEASEDLMSTLAIRNIIMYTVVSAVLIVAAFGIYNIISTVVLEKQREIAILKSIGFHARDIEYIFLLQGIIIGFLGNLTGMPFGMALITLLSKLSFKPPGITEPIQMPVDWGVAQFVIAGVFAFGASVLAALLPARKASAVQPVQILRGGQ